LVIGKSEVGSDTIVSAGVSLINTSVPSFSVVRPNGVVEARSNYSGYNPFEDVFRSVSAWRAYGAPGGFKHARRYGKLEYTKKLLFKGETFMPTVTIDDKEYDLDKLSDATKGQLTSMRLADAEIQRLNIQLAITQTARNAYALALKKDLEALSDNSKK
jgi:hypothetical protein